MRRADMKRFLHPSIRRAAAAQHIFFTHRRPFLSSTTVLFALISLTGSRHHLDFSVPFARAMSSSSSTTSTSKRSTTTATTWQGDVVNRQRALERCIVPLSETSHKGSSGRIGVLGGSARYTGAPYYAGMAALKAGADLAFCFCATEAAVPLKCYSPELMVAPVYEAAAFDTVVASHQHDDLNNNDNGNTNNWIDHDQEAKKLVSAMVKEVCGLMDKLHALVVGPGLGRCPLVMEATAQIIQTAQKQYNLPLVVDADALFLLTLPRYQNLLSSNSLVVLTPNVMEGKRLIESAAVLPPETCIMIEKGAVDQIKPASNETSNAFTSMACGEVGGLKRSGGIGDVLAGTCGTLVAWNQILTAKGAASASDLPLSCWTACCFVKRSTKGAFDCHRRSMTAPDVLHQLGPTIDEMATEHWDN